MNFQEIKELIEIVNSSELAYFEFETNDGHIKMDKSLSRNITGTGNVNQNSEITDEKISNSNAATKNVENVVNNTNIENEDNDKNLKIITSPMVGTFYGAPSPDSEAFVSEGSSITKGNTLCIIEAMKLMNEIESEASGVVRKILAKDGDMVEYGQPLFKVEEK